MPGLPELAPDEPCDAEEDVSEIDKTTQRILDALKPKTPTRGEDPTCYCGQAFFDNDLLWRHIVKCPEARAATVAHLKTLADDYRVIEAHGTTSGYNRHKKHGDEVCDPCQVAWDEYWKRYRRDHPTRATTRSGKRRSPDR